MLCSIKCVCTFTIKWNTPTTCMSHFSSAASPQLSFAISTLEWVVKEQRSTHDCLKPLGRGVSRRRGRGQRAEGPPWYLVLPRSLTHNCAVVWFSRLVLLKSVVEGAFNNKDFEWQRSMTTRQWNHSLITNFRPQKLSLCINFHSLLLHCLHTNRDKECSLACAHLPKCCSCTVP